MLFDPTLEIPRYTWMLQRAYMWELMLPDIGGISGLFVSTFCQDIKFGDYGMEDVSSLKYGAFRAKYAGSLDIPDLTLTFLRPVPDQVTSYFYAWSRLIVTDEGYYNPKGNYARSLYVYLYDTTGAITNKIQLVGCFPKDLPGWDFSYESETISKISVTISVDRMAFGEFVSPVFAQDTVQPFTRGDIQDTSSITPQVRPNIAAPARYVGAVGAVPALAVKPATGLAGMLSYVTTGVISGLASNAISGLTSLATGFTSAVQRALNPLPPVAETSPFGQKLKGTLWDAPIRISPELAPIEIGRVVTPTPPPEAIKNLSSEAIKTVQYYQVSKEQLTTMADSVAKGATFYTGGGVMPSFNMIPL